MPPSGAELVLPLTQVAPAADFIPWSSLVLFVFVGDTKSGRRTRGQPFMGVEAGFFVRRRTIQFM